VCVCVCVCVMMKELRQRKWRSELMCVCVCVCVCVPIYQHPIIGHYKIYCAGKAIGKPTRKTLFRLDGDIQLYK